MPLRDLKYKRDQTILKVYGYGENKKIKVIRMNLLRTAGVEDDEEYRAPKGAVMILRLKKIFIEPKKLFLTMLFVILGIGFSLARLTLKSTTGQTLISSIRI